ncbi:DUF2510 domain-containing protein [Streptomyces sp. SBST2-5]|uniref:DUF2510 domain-containing protein n=1 Tax=Streptomyces composti TaxID=2720025 RepID=A0ABX1A8C2_9ACTN|nr:DUF2510 domain-containing protein [Streptomyces composti]NJP49748.1 DUF2510 domain-containing protein [Streptomyces composti]
MTQLTPPGWYPDPGQKKDGPATERWWDGGAWTDQVRPSGQAAGWGPPAPVRPPSRRRRAVRTGAAVAAAVAVLASIGAGVYVLADDDGGRGSSASQERPDRDGGRGDRDGDSGRDGRDGGSGGGPDGAEPGPEGSDPPLVRSGSVTDTLSGISLPVPKGWTGQEMQVGAHVSSEETYKCPGDSSKTCTKGGAYSSPALLLGTRGSTPEEIAKADIAENAEESYGGSSYGRITRHDVLASKAVTVAGQKGYLVRWRAVTSKGSDGFVQSVAFPSPARPERIVVVRLGVDTDQKQSLLDEITEGIEAASGGGRGQEV